MWWRKTKYPKPDRSNYQPSTDLDGDVELGFYEGVLADGRPFRAEIWWWDGLAGVTYLFSNRDLETATGDQIFTLLKRSGEVQKFPAELLRYAGGPVETKDSRGEPIWNFSFSLGSLSRASVGGQTIFLPEDNPGHFEPFRKIISTNVRFEPSFERILKEAKANDSPKHLRH